MLEFPFEAQFGSELPGGVAIIDTETTGFQELGRARIIELAAAKVNPHTGEVASRFQTLVRPQLHNLFINPTEAIRQHRMGEINLGNLTPETMAHIHPELRRSFEIHGITPKDILLRGVPEKEAVKRFQGWMEKEGIQAAGAYNIPFDRAMLARMGAGQIPWHHELDVMSHASRMLGELGYARYHAGKKTWAITAERAAQLLIDPDIQEAHRALQDVHLETNVLAAMGDVSNPMVREFEAVRAGEFIPSAKALGRRSLRKAEAYGKWMLKQAKSGAISRKVKPFTLGIAALAGLVVAGRIIRPLSGNDDDYNVIEGLPHGGVASNLRKYFTDFGSGWRGTFMLPKLLMEHKMLYGLTRTAEGEMVRTATVGLTVTAESLQKRFMYNMRFVPESERAAVALEAKSFIKNMAENPFQRAIVVDPRSVARFANKSEITYAAALKRTLKHERFHQILDEIPGLRKALASNPKITEEQVANFLRQRPSYKNLPGPKIVEEMMAMAEETGRLKIPQYRELMKGQKESIISVGRKRKLRMAQAQQETSKAMSINGLRGGSSHNIPGNKSKI